MSRMATKRQWVKVLLTEAAIERLEYNAQSTSRSDVVEGLIWNHLNGPPITTIPTTCPGGVSVVRDDEENQ